MKYLGPEEIQGLVGLEEAIPAVEAAFRSLAFGEATLPEVIHVDLPEVEGEFHVKGPISGATAILPSRWPLAFTAIPPRVCPWAAA